MKENQAADADRSNLLFFRIIAVTCVVISLGAVLIAVIERLSQPRGPDNTAEQVKQSILEHSNSIQKWPLRPPPKKVSEEKNERDTAGEVQRSDSR